MPLYLFEVRFKADDDDMAREEAATAIQVMRAEFKEVLSTHLVDGYGKIIRDPRIDND